MANTLAPFGFKHLGYLGGGHPDFQLTERAIASNYATSLFFGDPVINSAAHPYISIAASTGTALAGIFQGCWYIPTGGGPPQYSPWWPASGGKVDATAFVIDAPNATFLAQSYSAPIGSTLIQQNIGFTTTGATATTAGGGISSYMLSDATSTSGFYPFRVVALYNGVGNGSDPTTNYNWAVVTFNYEQYRTGTATA
jgi:hypothetical protein